MEDTANTFDQPPDNRDAQPAEPIRQGKYTRCPGCKGILSKRSPPRCPNCLQALIREVKP